MSEDDTVNNSPPTSRRKRNQGERPANATTERRAASRAVEAVAPSKASGRKASGRQKSAPARRQASAASEPSPAKGRNLTAAAPATSSSKQSAAKSKAKEAAASIPQQGARPTAALKRGKAVAGVAEDQATQSVRKASVRTARPTRAAKAQAAVEPKVEAASPRRNASRAKTSASGNGSTGSFTEANGSVDPRRDAELAAGLELLGNNPFEADLIDIQRRRVKLREYKSRNKRADPLIELHLLDDPEESLIKGVAVIRQSLRDLLTGETARLVDASHPTELDALRKQLETRISILEGALKELSEQLGRLRIRQRESAAQPREAR